MTVHCPEQLRPLLTPIGDVHPAPHNPRTNHAVDGIARSLRELGWHAPLVARENGELIVGHGRLAAALQLGEVQAPVLYLDDDRGTAVARMVADNRLTELSDWDVEGLQAMVDESLAVDVDDELAALSGWIDDLDLDEVLGEIESPTPPADPGPQIDMAEELRKKWGVETGQLWELGEHRLLCGDATKADSFDCATGEKINVVVTSPPYASQRKYDEKTGFRPIPPDGYVAWWEAVQSSIRRHLADDGSFFLNIKPASRGLSCEVYVLDLVIAHVRQWGWTWATEFCWQRVGMPGRPKRRFKNQFEPVYQFTLGEWKFRPLAVVHDSDKVPSYSKFNHWAHGLKEAAGHVGSGWEKVEKGKAYPGNLLPVFGNAHGTRHEATFPVGLPSFFILAYSDEHDVVCDPFSGSGSTLIACEQLDRRCRAIEISPGYVAVALQRWAEMTGKTPKLL